MSTVYSIIFAKFLFEQSYRYHQFNTLFAFYLKHSPFNTPCLYLSCERMFQGAAYAGALKKRFVNAELLHFFFIISAEKQNIYHKVCFIVKYILGKGNSTCSFSVISKKSPFLLLSRIAFPLTEKPPENGAFSPPQRKFRRASASKRPAFPKKPVFSVTKKPEINRAFLKNAFFTESFIIFRQYTCGFFREDLPFRRMRQRSSRH